MKPFDGGGTGYLSFVHHDPSILINDHEFENTIFSIEW